MKKYIVLTILSFVLASCGSNEKTKAEEKQKKASNLVSLSENQIKNAELVVSNPIMQDIQGLLQLQGSVVVPPKSIVSVSFPLGGYIKSTNLLQGMHVKKGAVLAVVEDMQFIQLQQDYLTAREKYQLAATEFKRQKELNSKKASSDKVTEQALSDRETQSIYVASLAQKLQMIGINPNSLTVSRISKTVRIVAPIDGLVSKININIGKYISPTDMLFEVININDVVLELNAFEKDVHSLFVGQNVACYVNGNKAKKYNAKITYINNSLNEDRAATIICKFDHYDKVLLPGFFINADVEVTNEKAMTLPENAVVRWQDKFFVFEEKEKGQYQMIAVEAGTISNGIRQVSSSMLNASSRLVTKNAYTLLMKMMNSSEE